MKKILIIILLAFNIGNTSAQNIKFDSLKRVLAKKMPNDPARLNILEKLATGYMEYKPDSSIYYSQQGIDWGTKYNSDNVVASARDILGEALYIKGDYPKALDVALSARYYFETSKNKTHLAYTYNLLGNIYKGLENYPQAKIYYRHCLQNATAAKDTAVMSFAVLNLAAIFNQTNNLDSALYYIPKP